MVLEFFQCPDCGLIQIFDADHSPLYADLVLGEIHIFPAQAAEFAYTDAGMHAKQQTKMKSLILSIRNFSSWL